MHPIHAPPNHERPFDVTFPPPLNYQLELINGVFQVSTKKATQKDATNNLSNNNNSNGDNGNISEKDMENGGVKEGEMKDGGMSEKGMKKDGVIFSLPFTLEEFVHDQNILLALVSDGPM